MSYTSDEIHGLYCFLRYSQQQLGLFHLIRTAMKRTRIEWTSYFQEFYAIIGFSLVLRFTIIRAKICVRVRRKTAQVDAWTVVFENISLIQSHVRFTHLKFDSHHRIGSSYQFIFLFARKIMAMIFINIYPRSTKYLCVSRL